MIRAPGELRSGPPSGPFEPWCWSGAALGLQLGNRRLEEQQVSSDPRLKQVRALSLESRRQHEMRRLLEKQGAVVLAAPSMSEVPLSDQREALAFGAALSQGNCDALVLLTAVGTRTLLNALTAEHGEDAVRRWLSATTLLCRGPKPVAVLQDFGLRPALVAPAPNTSEDLLRAWDASTLPISGQRLFVQEYGTPNHALHEALRERGASVTSVTVYAWSLPQDREPLKQAAQALANGEIDLVLFTSAKQLDHLLLVAEQEGIGQAPVVAALQRRCVIASVGPVTSAALRAQAIGVDFESPQPKMGHMVVAVARAWPQLRTKLAAPEAST